jgi:hypothetical protein
VWVTDSGNDAGDDFGKFSLEGGESTKLFLGDEFGKCRVFLLIWGDLRPVAVGSYASLHRRVHDVGVKINDWRRIVLVFSVLSNRTYYCSLY